MCMGADYCYTDLPPSALVVLDLLEDGNAHTFKEMSHGADIAPRTMRYALKRLKEKGYIIEKFNFTDARQILYQRSDCVSSPEHARPATVIE
jgi:DNA-binding MarR family transcriptional regulator